jgi:hypothetical protein
VDVGHFNVPIGHPAMTRGVGVCVGGGGIGVFVGVGQRLSRGVVVAQFGGGTGVFVGGTGVFVGGTGVFVGGGGTGVFVGRGGNGVFVGTGGGGGGTGVAVAGVSICEGGATPACGVPCASSALSSVTAAPTTLGFSGGRACAVKSSFE